MSSRGKALIFTAALAAGIGCGARTDTLFDDGADGSGLGGEDTGGGNTGGQAHGGSSGTTAGRRGLGGSNGGGFGTAGNIGVGGAIPTAGSHAGGAATAGSVGTGGTFPMGGSGTAGSPSGGTAGSPSGGTVGLGGSFGTAGFGAVGGDAGAGGSGGIVQVCVDAAPNACGKCLCQSCGSALEACFTDIGCALILACAQQAQCQGFDCYQSSTCRGVIDQFGGLTGAPAAEAFSLVRCTVTARSSCGCN